MSAHGLERARRAATRFSLLPEARSRRGRVRDEIVADARARSVPRLVAMGRSAAAHAASTTWARSRRLRGRRQVRAVGRARASEVPVSLRAAARRSRARREATRSRASSLRRGSRSSYGARSRTPSCSSSRRRTAEGSGRARATGRAHARRSARRRRSRRTSRSNGSGSASSTSLAPDPAVFADVDRRHPRSTSSRRRGFSSTASSATIAAFSICSTAEHTFVNESLALHYGINDIRGKRFRRVELADENRWGLLGKGGVLLVSSYPNRTSPVLRGAWLLENLLGTPPASPPPNVEALIENVEGEAASTVRERLEAHRTNPSCNACHGIIDPLGFALENFDAVGRWRDMDREAGTPIDASGVLTDGTAVDGPVALRDALLDAAPAVRSDVHREAHDLRAWPHARVRGHADRPAHRERGRARRTTAFPRSWGIVKSAQFRMQGASANRADELTAVAVGDWPPGGFAHVHHQETPVAKHLPSRARRVAVAAVARCDDPGRHGARADRRRAEAEAGLLLSAARRRHRIVGRPPRRAAHSSCRRFLRRLRRSRTR